MNFRTNLSDGNCYALPELTSVFYSSDPSDIAIAKDICSDCPAIFRCRSWALDHGETGIWGGLTDDERRRYIVTSTLMELRYTSSPHNGQHVQVRLVSAYSSSPSHTSSQPNHTLQALSWDFASESLFQPF